MLRIDNLHAAVDGKATLKGITAGILFCSLSAAQNAPSPAPVRETTTGFEIPGELMPAVAPYVGCLLASRGVPFHGPGDPRPPGVARGADCTSRRAEAGRQADMILRRLGRDPGERRALIDRTLDGVDAFVSGATLPPPPSASQGSTDAPH